MADKDDLEILAPVLEALNGDDLNVALRAYDGLVRDAPEVSGYHVNRGNILQALGRPNEALEAFDWAIRVSPSDPVSHFNRGNLLRAIGRAAEAIEAYGRAITFNSHFAEAFLNRGIVLKGMGRNQEALEAYDNAVAENPSLFLAHYNRGVLLQELGKHEDALRAFEASIDINPRYAKAQNNRGNLLRVFGRNEEAVQAFRLALEIDGKCIEALINYGNFLRSQGMLQQALGYLDSAIHLNPASTEAHLNRSATLQEMGYFHRALEACDSALARDPDSISARLNRAGILKDLGLSQKAMDEYDWVIARKPDLAVGHSNRLFSLHYWEENVQRAIFPAALEYGREFGYAANEGPYTKNKRNQAKLRVGYVSADFRCHSVGFFLQQVFAHHDLQQIELFVYNNGEVRDNLTEALSGKVTHWVDILGLPDDSVADRIRADGIDILVDLSGHSAGNRLPVFAMRPSPVQVSWLGYFGTTGLSAMDYVIGDGVVTPAGCEKYFVERIYRLPGCYLCYTPPALDIDTSRLGGKAREITFGSFNNVAKISDSTIKLWARVLDESKDSRLVLRDKSFTELSMRKRMLARFGSFGLAAERLSLEPALGRREYLESYRHIDVALDPTPYGGGTTTADALWMGVPVVTLRGKTWAGRISTSILNALGIPEFSAQDENEYVSIASSLARDREKKEKLARELRRKMLSSGFCDGAWFTQTLEAAYRTMWSDWFTT
ncbi:tetratricopeptide repeat protein [Thiorhodovibrio frisius]|uniref:protein O-GlcNAc transferase n=1 Tax=Thiorhodovibrio frisius TaxID=631362 RepID=H8Z5B8_9GAMM|nr:glycosyltransferase family 41 protein [Thiorhodovibrio frisius]EIC20525.1 putative O-linked N-acetylglucosamine transferase, SPINDLY family [Thiorhodovibrio frisius]WPL21270.1 TPR repeat-containing protein YrrB [Thiorhodovibrio frisius]